MSTVIAQVTGGGFTRPASPAPALPLYTTLDASNYTFYDNSDLFSAAIPATLGANLFSGTRVVPSRFLGITAPPASGLVFNNSRNYDAIAVCDWARINPANGTYVWTGLDYLVAQAYAANADFVFCFANTPHWASARPAEADSYGIGGAFAEPSDMAYLATFATVVATRYKNRGTPIKYFEIWNEPKYMLGNASYFTGTPAKLAEMAYNIYTSVKAVDPTCTVAGVGTTGCIPSGVNSGSDYLDQFLTANDNHGGTGKDNIDAVSFHSYAHDGANQYWGYPLGIGDAFTNVRAVMTTRGISTYPIIVTEGSLITPAFNTSPKQYRVDSMKRMAWMIAALGAARFTWYAFNGPLGWTAADTDITAIWNQLVDDIGGATITVCNKLTSGRIALVVDGSNVLL